MQGIYHMLVSKQLAKKQNLIAADKAGEEARIGGGGGAVA